MNKNEFVKLINLLIEKKLKEILPKMISAEISKHTESGIEPSQTDYAADSDLKHLIPGSHFKNSILTDDDSYGKEVHAEGKKWTKNSTINRILNETAQNFTANPKDPADTYQQLFESEYQDIDSEFTFNTNNMTDALNPVRAGTNEMKTDSLKQEVMRDTGASPAIAEKMIRNYSKDLEKMDKIAKSKRVGGSS